MKDFEKILADALKKETAHLNAPTLATISPNTNVFENVDSLTIVNVLLQTELMLEMETGKYVPLADETVFDAEKSPLVKWSSWIRFVEARHSK